MFYVITIKTKRCDLVHIQKIQDFSVQVKEINKKVQYKKGLTKMKTKRK